MRTDELREELAALAARLPEQAGDVLALVEERVARRQSSRRRRTTAVALLVLLGASAFALARFDHNGRDVKIITTPTRRREAIGSVVRVPPRDEATATWLDDGTPVFVVND